MFKKYNNIFLFILLIFLICFCLFNRSLMENLENLDAENLDTEKLLCNKSSVITFSGKSKNKNNSEHPHSKLQTALKKSKINNICTNYNALPELEAAQ